MTSIFYRRSRTSAPAPSAPQTVPAVPAVPDSQAASEYALPVLPATRRGIAAQVTTVVGIVTGLWVALSPLFITLQHGGLNAAFADVIAGLAVAVLGGTALASRRGFGGLQLATGLLGVWVIISSFILNAKFSMAAPMYWSNSWSGALLVVLTLATFGTIRRATR